MGSEVPLRRRVLACAGEPGYVWLCAEHEATRVRVEVLAYNLMRSRPAALQRPELYVEGVGAAWQAPWEAMEAEARRQVRELAMYSMAHMGPDATATVVFMDGPVKGYTDEVKLGAGGKPPHGLSRMYREPATYVSDAASYFRSDYLTPRAQQADYRRGRMPRLELDRPVVWLYWHYADEMAAYERWARAHLAVLLGAHVPYGIAQSAFATPVYNELASHFNHSSPVSSRSITEEMLVQRPMPLRGRPAGT